MKKKFSITLLVAMFSLFIIGFGGATTAEAIGECAETQLANGASASAAFTNCRAYEADAARYASIGAFYTSEANKVQHGSEAEAARYTGLAALYTPDIAGPCLGIGSINLTAAELVDCRSDSAYQAANPELMVSRRFMVINDNAAGQPVSVGVPTLHQRIYNDWVIESEAVDVSALGQPSVFHQPILVDRQLLYNLLEKQQAAVQPIDINDLYQRVYSDWVIENEAVDVSILGQPAQGILTLHQRIYSDWVIEAEAVDVSALGQPSVFHQPILVDVQLLYNLIEEQRAAAQPIDINDLYQRVYSDWVIENEAVDVSILEQPAQSNVAGQSVPIDIEVLRNNYYNSIQAARNGD